MSFIYEKVFKGVIWQPQVSSSEHLTNFFTSSLSSVSYDTLAINFGMFDL